jgi:hypothetical protein
MPRSNPTISFDDLSNPEDWLLADPSPFANPLSAMLAREYEQDAQIAGFESVADYLQSYPGILNLH